MHIDRLREILSHLNMAVEEISLMLNEEAPEDKQKDIAPPQQPVQEDKISRSYTITHSEPLDFISETIISRFPDVEVPNASAASIWDQAQGNKQWITDTVDITLDYHNTKYAVSKPVGFIISALKRGNPEQAREQAQQIQKFQATTGNSLIDDALETAKSRIKEPVPEQKTSRLRQIKEESGTN